MVYEAVQVIEAPTGNPHDMEEISCRPAGLAIEAFADLLNQFRQGLTGMEESRILCKDNLPARQQRRRYQCIEEEVQVIVAVDGEEIQRPASGRQEESCYFFEGFVDEEFLLAVKQIARRSVPFPYVPQDETEGSLCGIGLEVHVLPKE